MRYLPLLLLGASLCAAVRPVAAAPRIPGEIETLTDEARAKATAELEILGKAGTSDAATQAARKARRALLLMGPAVWPVVDNACRLGMPAPARPHAAFLKALLAPKSEPELDELRARLRVKMLNEAPAAVREEAVQFRLGKPDPKHPGRRIAPSIKPVVSNGTSTFRSSDGSLVVVFGDDGKGKSPDAPDVTVSEPTAGFVVAVGGAAAPYARTSGHGANVSVVAPMGYAFGFSTDGAAGLAPGGNGGEGGVASVEGGAGQHARSGNGGGGAPAGDGR